MTSEEREEQLKIILTEAYADFPHASLYSLFYNLNRIAFSPDSALMDIIRSVIEWEAEEEMQDTQAYYIYACVLDMLDDCPATAKRLFQTFVYEYDDFNTFYKLYEFNGQYLTGEELLSVKKKAWKLFDKELMREYGYDWGDLV